MGWRFAPVAICEAFTGDESMRWVLKSRGTMCAMKYHEYPPRTGEFFPAHFGAENKRKQLGETRKVEVSLHWIFNLEVKTIYDIGNTLK